MSYSNGPRIVTNGLVCCLDAANTKSYPGSGTTWYDISGNGRNFTWDGVDWTNGYFNTFTSSSSTYRRATGPASNSFGINNTTGYTIFFVFQTTAASNNSAFKFYGSAVGTRGIFCHPSWITSSNTIYFDQGGCCNGDQRITYTDSNMISSTLWKIVALRSTVATRSILYNGSKVTNTATAAANIDLTSTAVGLNPSDEGYSWQGRLAYFSIYNRGITDIEYLQNYNAIKSRFNL